MQAVFTSSYLHSAIIYVAVVLFSIYVYSGSDGHPIGSIGEVYENLKARSAVSLLYPCLPQAWFIVGTESLLCGSLNVVCPVIA